jgi:hypothetical protein
MESHGLQLRVAATNRRAGLERQQLLRLQGGIRREAAERPRIQLAQ